MLGWLVFAVVACNNTVTTTVDRCDVDLSEVKPASAPPGATVLATGDGPFLNERDSAVFVGGVRAQLLEVNGGTDECRECITCRLEADCSVCDETCAGSDGLTEERTAECFAAADTEAPGFCTRCTFSLQIVVPDVKPGPTQVWTFNEIGTSQPVPFTVEGPAATGDTGTATDTGTTTDTGTSTTTGSTGDTGKKIP